MSATKVNIYKLYIGDEIHSVLETPSQIPISENALSKTSSSTLNIAMIDVSGSMCMYWNPLMKYWNEFLAPLMPDIETTKIFVFGTDVYFKRNGTELKEDDFLSESTNLTDAIATINSEVHASKHDFIRLFLLTDGDHNATEVEPSVEIEKLSIPSGKTVEVYLFGFGCGFPVEYSITIRSALHNGNSNVPSLFWAKCEEEDVSPDILQEIESIADIVKKGCVKIKIDPPGKLAPGFPNTNISHLGEFVYFPSPPDSLALNMSTEDDIAINVQLQVKEADLRFLLDKVFRQWNSIIIQHHRQKKQIPNIPFEVMDSIYKHLMEKLYQELNLRIEDKSSIRYRLAKKDVKYLETEYATLMNQSKTIIGLEGQYSSEIELAENILKTTVKSKHDVKNLKMKGHGFEDFENDMKAFKEILEKIKQDIMNIPEPSPDECCRVTMGSMIKDLQDSFLEELLKEDKFTFMKTFTVTGIPIFAPVKSFSQINPWTLCIENILRSPYTIVSQSTLELSAEFNSSPSTTEDKEVYLQEGDEDSKFNAIVPVFTPETAEILKPLVRTNIFAMLSTFCVLKNPHIIDYNAHMAGLGCTWIKLITGHDKSNRPEYVNELLQLIYATARLYLDRAGFAKYFEVLVSDPKEALMTESTKTYMDEKTLKCESLIKPMFLLYLNHNKIEFSSFEAVIPLLILEFIGRILTKYQTDHNSSCLYSTIFVPELSTEKLREEYFEKKCEETSKHIMESFYQQKGNFIDTFFTVEDLLDSLKEFCRKYFKTVTESIYTIRVNANLIMKLKNATSAGNIRLNAIREFLIELNLSDTLIESYFDEKIIFVYALQCLKTKSSSKDRLTNPLPSYEEAHEAVKRMINKENKNYFESKCLKAVLSIAEKKWREDYFRIHSNEVAEPMTKEQILFAAQGKGVQVNEQNFDQIFRYNIKSKLLRNACMLKNCPFYLIPNRSFNQHISVEREKEFPHQLHKISHEVATQNGTSNDVISHILKEGYESQNGLKVPQVPSQEYLSSIDCKIEHLVNQYKGIP
ncbi:UNVERIFIED_CONTAM: hypothetical protein RMT77_006536 [Armadillidium vulgare]